MTEALIVAVPVYVVVGVLMGFGAWCGLPKQGWHGRRRIHGALTVGLVWPVVALKYATWLAIGDPS